MRRDAYRQRSRWMLMRVLWITMVLAAGCFVPSRVATEAAARLGVHGKKLILADYDRIDGSDVYTFCRGEHRRDIGSPVPIGARSYDGACITLVCPAGDDGHRCR